MPKAARRLVVQAQDQTEATEKRQEQAEENKSDEEGEGEEEKSEESIMGMEVTGETRQFRDVG